jgi:hypothetical protein
MRFPARPSALVPRCLVAALLSLAGTARAQAPLLEVEKSDATKLLKVTDDAGFLVRGENGDGAIPEQGAGVRLMWYPGKLAFRAGGVEGPHWDDAQIGRGSVALGVNTSASGEFSLALNVGTKASGTSSVAAGRNTLASGPGSVALGEQTTAGGNQATAVGGNTEAAGHQSFAAGLRTEAIGPSSTAFGEDTRAAGRGALAAGLMTQANGIGSVAMGTGTVAAGDASVALGSGITARGAGSFAFGDSHISHALDVPANSFLVRAHGGIGLTSGIGTGCDLPPNSGAWACASSKLVKEDFEDVDGEDVLARLKGVRIQSWRYIGTSARHLGPFAEDFSAAFGLGDSPTRIAQIDADGVALSAVQALERRTGELRAENVALRMETAELRAENAALGMETAELRRRLEALERSEPHR